MVSTWLLNLTIDKIIIRIFYQESQILVGRLKILERLLRTILVLRIILVLILIKLILRTSLLGRLLAMISLEDLLIMTRIIGRRIWLWVSTELNLWNKEDKKCKPDSKQPKKSLYAWKNLRNQMKNSAKRNYSTKKVLSTTKSCHLPQWLSSRPSISYNQTSIRSFTILRLLG